MRQGLRRARRAFALLAAAAVLAVPAALAGDGAVQQLGEFTAGSGPAISESTDLWFVELAESPATFRSQAKSANIDYTERFTYGRLWNGVSVQATPTAAKKFEALGSVKALYPVEIVQMPEVTPDLATAIAQTGADIAQNTLGLSGEGVKVAIMDTGVDYDHPDLGGCFGPGCRVEAGYDFVGDAFNASPYNADGTPNAGYSPTPVPDDDPDDCNGHGTHVAGIVGADAASSSGVTGVAPGVTFGAYRVFGCEGSTTADIMLAAMERALADGMHILNMSIGSAHNTWPQYPTAAGADALVDAGMVVVASIGNSGVDGLFSAGAPGVGNNVIGTASFDNSHVNSLTFDAPGRTGIAYLPISTTEDPPTSGTTPEVVFVGQGCTADPYLADPAGKVALIVRGVCTFAEKYNKAVAAGAVDVIIHNNVPGLFAGGGVVGQPGISAVAISQEDGLYLRSLASPYSVTWTQNRVNAVNPTGGLLSSFTSYGVNAELTLKPDIGAPGGLIRSTYPLEHGAYAIVSGTSMASPHVAGAAALLKQARPLLPADGFRDVLQNSADPKNWSLNAGAGLLDHTFRQGAGMIDVDDAILSTTTVTPGKLSLGESAAGPQTRTVTVRNHGASTVTYALSHVEAIGTSPTATYPYGFGFVLGGSGAAFSASSVTVPAGGTASFDVTLTDLGYAERTLYGGYIVLTPTAGSSQVMRVPYAGIAGDYQAIVHMPTRTVAGFGTLPALGRRTATPGAFFAVEPPTGGTYTLASEQQVPYLLLHFDHQPRRLEVEVVQAANGKRLHPVFSNVIAQDYLPKNATLNSFFAFAWDGNRLHSNGQGAKAGLAWKTVPDGQYKLNVKVLKALGDPANPAHWETWTSPTITIDRP